MDEPRFTGEPRPAAPAARVLHVDDSDANRYAVSRQLRHAGFEVVEAATGAEALARMADAAPDVVVLDVRLPDVDGFEVCRRIKADPRTRLTPVLHLSASYVTGHHKAEGLDAGADAYLIRPVEPVELVATLNALLRQRRAEEAAIAATARAREGEARFRNMADHAPVMIWITEPDGSCVYLNRRWYDFTGQAEAEALGMGWLDATHPDDKAAAGEAFVRANAARGPFHIEYRLRRHDGAYRWAIDSAAPRFGPGGEWLGYVGSVTEIHDRRTAEDAVRAYRDRLSTSNLVAGVGTFDYDPRSGVNLWTPELEALYGLPPGGFAGTYDAWKAMVHPDDLPRAQAAVTGALADGVYDVEFRVRLPDESHRWLAGRGRVLMDADGRPERFVGVNIDITAQKRAEQQLVEAKAAADAARDVAETANRLKDDFLATLSHELRTPLTAIVGWATLLRRPQLGEAERANGLTVIERNARVQSQLIEDLLDVSRISSGKLRLDVRPVDLGGLVEAAVQAVEPAAEAKGVALVRVLESGGSTTVSGDAGRLQQVVWNLLANAVKFTPKGGRVRVSLARVDSSAEIVVTDNGRGIAAGFLPYVFERFRQADATTTRQHGGLGLGLAIARHLVEMHGGTIRVDSPGEGRGATFTVRLPVTVVRRAPEEAAPASRPAEVGTADGFDCDPSLAGARVLVVDDEPDARDLLRRVLETCEAVVTTAGSAREAMAALAEDGGRFDALVSDIGMPGEDGYELIRRVRALPAAAGGRVAAVALTAFARAEDRRRALLAGFQVHVAKPVDPSELLAVVAGLIGRTGNGGDRPA